MTGKLCRILKLCTDADLYDVMNLEPRKNMFAWPSLVNYHDKIIFVIGGRCGGRFAAPKNTVESYDLGKGAWRDSMPSLVEARAGASGCSLPNYVYIFCGMKENRKRLNSIERLRIITLERPSQQLEERWELIQLKIEILPARSNPVIVPMNSTKIAILGGLMQKDEAYMGDILLFDARTKTCNTLISNSHHKSQHQNEDEQEEESSTPSHESQLKVSSAANQAGLAGQDTFVSLVNASTDAGETCPMIIGYKRGAAKVFKIQEFSRETT